MFATTRWSLVHAAGDDSTEARAALEQLCRIYRPAVLAWLRGRGYARTDAEDLTQGFFARFIEKRLHASADPERGRFRTYLRASLHHFVVNVHAYEQADRRRTRAAAGAIDPDTLPGDESALPDRAFERAWALATVERARHRLRREAEAAGKAALFERLQEVLLEPPGRDEYAAIAEAFGTRPNTIAVAAHRLRQRLRELVVEQIRLTVADPADVDDEFAVLDEALRTLGRGRR
jgi:RNA polymerase sigma factor (sigma-70 family)